MFDMDDEYAPLSEAGPVYVGHEYDAYEMQREVDAALSMLDPRMQTVLNLRFGIEGDTHTLEAAGKVLGITRERVRQIEAKALRKLRHPRVSNRLKHFLDI